MLIKTILIFPFDLMSHYLRCIQLASMYKNHTILFAHSKKYNQYVINAGYEVFQVENFEPEVVMECSRKFSFSWLNEKDIERIYLSQIEVINHYRPEMVIGDTCPTLKMAAEKCGVKYIGLMNAYMSKYYAHTRALSRTHPGYTHLKKLPPNVSDKITQFAEKIAFRIVHKPFKKIRRKYKLGRVSNYLNEMEGDENLLCDDTKLFPQTHLPKNYKVIGPLITKQKTNESDLIAKLNPIKTTICICMGSSGDWSKLDFLSNSKYKHLNIITAGDTEKALCADHIIKKDFINLDEVLPMCKYLICHGGNGTIYKGIEHNVFMLCLTSHFEQEWNVQMLERLNLGINVSDDPEILLAKFLTV